MNTQLDRTLIGLPIAVDPEGHPPVGRAPTGPPPAAWLGLGGVLDHAEREARGTVYGRRRRLRRVLLLAALVTTFAVVALLGAYLYVTLAGVGLGL